MKNTILVFISIIILSSCASKKTAVVATQTQAPPSTSRAVSAEVQIKGSWTLTKVAYVGSEYFKVTSFQIADSKCFEGSVWNFISNNEKGDMALTAAGCTAFSSPIVWSIRKDQVFSLKILRDAKKSKEVTTGYYLKIQNQTENSFELLDKMNVGGKLTDIVYTFEKNNKK